jgi:hypothetical protein
MPTQVTLEQYATIRARVRTRGALRVVLEEEKLAEESWNEARTNWSAAIDEELSRNETDLVSRFVAAFKTASAPPPLRASEPPALSLPSPQRPIAKASYQLQRPVPPADAGAHEPPLNRSGVPAPAPALAQRPPSHLQSTIFHPDGMPIPKASPFVAPATPPPQAQASSMPVAPRIGSGTSLASLPLPASEVLPFKGGKHSGENVPGWTVEHYAALCIDLVASGAAKHEVLMRYGIVEQQCEAMNEYWQNKILDDASIGSRWERASADRRAWWRQGGR